MMGRTIEFPTDNVSISGAWAIVKTRLDDPELSIRTKVLAIEQVAEMETHNSVTKEELVGALRWLFQHYNFEGE
ncbi:Uncharacterised protein [uncultured Flavonifractor sp.]|jgi:hypothetical protein|nr:Uncharacterised protein [uncultured Flavonifractor sp.]